jgi:hypothetical protein
MLMSHADEGVQSLSSHASAALPRQLGHGVLSSHVVDGAVEVMLAVV